MIRLTEYEKWPPEKQCFDLRPRRHRGRTHKYISLPHLKWNAKYKKKCQIDRLYFVLKGSFRRCLSRFYVGKSHVTITLQGHFFA